MAAAGNSNEDTLVGASEDDIEDRPEQYPCSFSLHDMSVICVGAVNNAYGKAAVSNYGRALDFAAPGESEDGALIFMAKGGSDYFTNKKLITSGETDQIGTSVATSISAGIAAIIVGWEALHHNIEDCKKLKERFRRNALQGVMSEWPTNYLDLLLNTGIMRFGRGKGPVCRGCHTMSLVMY